MKKYLLLTLFVMILSVAYADESDITQSEVQPDVAKWIIDTVDIRAVTEQATVIYRKVDTDGNYISEIKIVFQNVMDNPETPEDETSTEFTQFIAFITNRIRANDSLKLAIQKAVKVKLGI